jgi:hypothetical protein
MWYLPATAVHVRIHMLDAVFSLWARQRLKGKLTFNIPLSKYLRTRNKIRRLDKDFGILTATRLTPSLSHAENTVLKNQEQNKAFG